MTTSIPGPLENSFRGAGCLECQVVFQGKNLPRFPKWGLTSSQKRAYSYPPTPALPMGLAIGQPVPRLAHSSGVKVLKIHHPLT